MARTNIVLDEELIEQVQALTGAATKREAVDIALRRLVAMASAYRALRKLRGKLAWDGDLDAWRGGRG
jgi:Arc/MetJ family transcription regulator